ncbi:Sterile alpha motif [Branchiostoma belcheri]|nr:Sterile alpha motif [Branchiostoma belcheri]
MGVQNVAGSSQPSYLLGHAWPIHLLAQRRGDPCSSRVAPSPLAGRWIFPAPGGGGRTAGPRSQAPGGGGRTAGVASLAGPGRRRQDSRGSLARRPREAAAGQPGSLARKPREAAAGQPGLARRPREAAAGQPVTVDPPLTCGGKPRVPGEATRTCARAGPSRPRRSPRTNYGASVGGRRRAEAVDGMLKSHVTAGTLHCVNLTFVMNCPVSFFTALLETTHTLQTARLYQRPSSFRTLIAMGTTDSCGYPGDERQLVKLRPLARGLSVPTFLAREFARQLDTDGSGYAPVGVLQATLAPNQRGRRASDMPAPASLPIIPADDGRARRESPW